MGGHAVGVLEEKGRACFLKCSCNNVFCSVIAIPVLVLCCALLSVVPGSSAIIVRR